MKKRKVALGLGLIILLVYSGFYFADYVKYSPVKNAAPFSTWLLANALYFIIPAIAMFIIGMIIKKKM